ncbi:MAG TPA: hypothetical protein VK573_07930 [Gemmatimonadales bacterium]|nr:hypothetical protein [Gemmatimonadales bacterium]
MAWRTAAAAGDVKVIRDIVQDSLDGYRSTKRPKTVAPDVWRGVQSLQIVEVRPDLVRVSCQAESDYTMVEGRSVETANPLQSGMAMTARAMDMLMYELPHYKPERVQIDVYATFREADRASERACILSTTASREAASAVDWEEWTPSEIVEALEGRYRMGDLGQPLPIEVEPPVSTEGEPGEAPPAAAKR